MPEPSRPLSTPPAAPAESQGTSPAQRAPCSSDAVLCERCGAEMFRMHAVWRCPACRYKTDCCGW